MLLNIRHYLQFKHNPIPAIVSLLLLSFLLSACGGGGSNSGGGDGGGTNPPGETNKPPVANAGSNQTVNEGVTVILDGSASSDPDGTIKTYSWKQTAGTKIELTKADTAKASFTAPAVKADESLSFELTVTDEQGATATSSTQVTVKNVNQAPIANAGADQTVNEGTAVTLDGSASSDPDGTIKTYSWKQTAGTKIELTKADTAKASFTAPDVVADETLTFELTVTDDKGAKAQSSVRVVVKNVSVVSKVTLSGTAFDAAIVGGTVTVKDLAEKVLGTATTNADGKFTIQVAADDIKNGYSLSVTGGTMDGVAFSDILTATYTSSDAKDAVNLTVVTTLVDSLATTAVGATKLAKREAAIQQLAKIGMVKADNWHLLISDYFSLQALTWRIKDAGGVKAWLDVVKADLTDGELSVEEMRSLFPKAHGGIEEVSFLGDMSAFPGEKSEGAIFITPKNAAATPVLKLIDPPAWVKVDGQNITAIPPTNETPAVHSFTIEVSPDGVITGRKITVDTTVLKRVTLLKGVLGTAGGKIENEWRDIALSVPAGKLSQSYEFTYTAGINNKGEIIFSMKTSPQISAEESAEVNIEEPASSVLRKNYLGESPSPSNAPLPMTAKSAVATAANNTILGVPDECAEEWYKHGADSKGNKDGFQFGYILQSKTAQFSLYVPGVAGTTLATYPRLVDLKGVVGFPKVTIDDSNTDPDKIVLKYDYIKNKKTRCASMLLTKDIVIEPTSTKDPVLLVHGYAEGEMGAIDDYFVRFPKLLRDAGFDVYTFVWNTNSRFEDTANELGQAIKKINDRTHKQTHIIAHSYGGLLTRALLQGLAEKPNQDKTAMIAVPEYDKAFMEKRIATVTTVGTPHSGIFRNADSGKAISFDAGDPIDFYDGQGNGYGELIRMCSSIPCYEAGEVWSSLFENNSAKPEYSYGVKKKSPGQIVYRLANKVFEKYPNVPTNVLIGIYPKDAKVRRNHSNNGEVVYYADSDLGDNVISLKGQRFIPSLDKLKYSVLSAANGFIHEHMLGFNAEKFLPGGEDKLLDKIYFELNDGCELFSGDCKLTSFLYGEPLSRFLNNGLEVVSYHHMGSTYNLVRKLKEEGLYDFNDAGGYPNLTEVGLQNCNAPQTCKHATWNYFNALVKDHPAKSLDATQKVKAKGSVGYAAPAAARTAGTAALAAGETVEGFVVNIFLDGEQLGTTTTDANGAFDLDVEFKPKRTYVLEVYPPASMDAAVAPRAIVVKKTSGLTVEDTDFDFSRLELIKNTKAPQQGELGVQLKDDSTGNVLLDYNLSVANFSYTLVNAKPINADSDAILTLPESLYAVTTTKSGYIGIGKSLCMVRQLASNSCVVTMLPNDQDKDGDGLSNLEEYNLGTNPAKADTDGDGYTDKQEVEASSDPLDKDKYPALSAPQNLKATTNDGKVTLSWDTVTGANNYNVCYATVSIANFNNCASYANGVLQNTSGTGLVLSDLTNGTTYYFRVQATEASGNKSPASNEVIATPNKASINDFTNLDPEVKDSTLNVGIDTTDGTLKLAFKDDGNTGQTFPYIWIANSGEGTISKLNVKTGQELGRYRTGPEADNGNPSRTTVDLDGNVWVGNRNNNTITKVGLLEFGQCIDRNKNGKIDTSTGGTDVKPWGGSFGDAQGITYAEDECVLQHVTLAVDGVSTPSDIRMLAIDKDNNVFAGGTGVSSIFKVNGATGAIIDAKDTVGSFYGGLVDKNGTVWAASRGTGYGYVIKISNDLQTQELINAGLDVYGIALNKYDEIWVTNAYAPAFASFNTSDPIGTLTTYQQEGRDWQPCYAQGIAVDDKDNIFIAGCASAYDQVVGHYKRIFDGTTHSVQYINNYTVGGGSTGVAVDGFGHIWSSNLFNDSVSRIILATDTTPVQIDTYPVGFQPYNYSDMTGRVVRTITSRQGTWEAIFDSKVEGYNWQQVKWRLKNALPAGTGVQVYAKTASSSLELNAKPYIEVQNGITAPELEAGRYLKLKVRLTSNNLTDTPEVVEIQLY